MQNFFFFTKNYRLSSLFAMATIFALLTGCGDGGTLPVTTTTTTTTGTATASSIQLLVSSQQMATSSIASVSLTAVVLDATGQAISGKVVTFAKGTDATAYFSGLSAITNSNGIATATLNLGSDMTNRIITVTASADAAVGSNTVTASGTKISVSGNTSLSLNATSTLTFIVKDSTGVSVPGVTLTVTSLNGNPIVLTPATGVTNSTGQISADITASIAGTGTDLISVSGAGASQTQTLTISGAGFAFTAPTIVAPATTPEILVNTATPVSVLWTNAAGAAVSGQTVNFYTSRGSITATAVTNGSGIATASVTAASTGSTILTAAGPAGTPAATLNVVLITNTANSITIQANPGTVAVNAGLTSGNQSVISVVVRDISNNLVKGAHITFSQVTDPTGGSLAASSATTDITGTASVNYIAGSTSSAQNGVQISATVDQVNGVAVAPKTATASLTVASQSLFVRLGTDNKTFPDVPVQGNYTKQYTALVTDAAGNPVADGTEVRFVIRPAPLSESSFFKGFFTWNVASTKWLQTVNVGCVSEDANQNFNLDPGEDINGNLRLDPLGVATVNATGTTTGGFAIAKISYAKEFAYWVQLVLEARAGTIGNDPPSTVMLILPGVSSDYTDIAVSPPGRLSPFGWRNAVCTDEL